MERWNETESQLKAKSPTPAPKGKRVVNLIWFVQRIKRSNDQTRMMDVDEGVDVDGCMDAHSYPQSRNRFESKLTSSPTNHNLLIFFLLLIFLHKALQCLSSSFFLSSPFFSSLPFFLFFLCFLSLHYILNQYSYRGFSRIKQIPFKPTPASAIQIPTVHLTLPTLMCACVALKEQAPVYENDKSLR